MKSSRRKLPARKASWKTPTGIAGLDYVLAGGLPRNRIHLVHGGPGAGKTTLGLQFLLEGRRLGERGLFITLLQTRAELEDTLASHGWSTDGIELAELPEHVRSTAAEQQTIFERSEVELSELADAVVATFARHRPQRLVLDSISDFAVLVSDSYQLRAQLLRLRHQLSRQHCTALFTAGDAAGEDLAAIETLAQGVISLEVEQRRFGQVRRSLRVTKMRGMDYLSGRHDFRIRTGGLTVYPRLQVPRESPRPVRRSRALFGSGIEQLDQLLGGGLQEGTSCLVLGTSGAGKSTICSLYVRAIMTRGFPAVVFCFDERPETLLVRSDNLGIRLRAHLRSGRLDLREIGVGQTSTGELVQQVREKVDRDGARLVVLDSLTGYCQAMGESCDVIPEIHELLGYLARRQVVTLMTETIHGLPGSPTESLHASYLADTVLVVRHFEALGDMRRCIAVFKKRHGPHETAIREMRIHRTGVVIGEPLREFSGVLSGQPTFAGAAQELMRLVSESGT